MLLLILRVLLIWWIATVIFRWISRLDLFKDKNEPLSGREKTNIDSGIEYTGDIEDADFEEIDNK